MERCYDCKRFKIKIKKKSVGYEEMRFVKIHRYVETKSYYCKGIFLFSRTIELPNEFGSCAEFEDKNYKMPDRAAYIKRDRHDEE